MPSGLWKQIGYDIFSLNKPPSTQRDNLDFINTTLYIDILAENYYSALLKSSWISIMTYKTSRNSFRACTWYIIYLSKHIGLLSSYYNYYNYYNYCNYYNYYYDVAKMWTYDESLNLTEPFKHGRPWQCLCAYIAACRVRTHVCAPMGDLQKPNFQFSAAIACMVLGDVNFYSPVSRSVAVTGSVSKALMLCGCYVGGMEVRKPAYAC